jgi:hypothetical protein
VEQARRAEDYFLDAIRRLNRLNSNTNYYHYYAEEAQKGLSLSQQWKDKLGV